LPTLIRGAAFHRPAPDLDAASRAPSRDTRFADHPLTAPEIESLQHASSPDDARDLLGRFHESRQPGPTLAQDELILLDRSLTEREQIALGVKPTPAEHRFIEAGAADTTELGRTLEFIEHRQSQNARYHLDAQAAVRQQQELAQQKNNTFWYEAYNRSPFAQREDRTEKTERRTDLTQQREHALQRQERTAWLNTSTNERDGQERETGGRER
jgi:hypothetical protein